MKRNGDKCPHCGRILDPVPQRKTKCPLCGKFIFVRTDPFSNQHCLLSEEDALSTDALVNLQISEREYRAIEKDLARRFKIEKPSRGDVVWSLISEKELSALSTRDWQAAKMLYWEQAHLLHSQGKDYFRPLQEAARCDLRSYESEGLKNVEISATASSCSKCKALNGRRTTIKDALRTMPIPVKDCERGWCRCYYLPVTD